MDPLMDDSSDGSDGPEEVDTKTTKEAFVADFEQRKNAVKSYRELQKNKRKLINDKYCQQKSLKSEQKIDKLSVDLLDEISMDGKAPKAKRNITANDETIVPKKRRKTKKSSTLKTESTHFNVMDVTTDLQQLVSIKAKDKKNGINFKDQMLFDRKRHKRLSSSAQKSYFDKQHSLRTK